MWLNMMVPYYLKKYEIDLFISPDGFLPTNCKTKTLDIIHDLNFFHYPQKIRWGWGAFYNKHFPKYAQQATRIATVSEFSKTDIAQQYQIAKSKIDVVYNGANEGFQPITETEITSTRNKYSNGHPYFFFVGSMYERKNIKRLLQAFELFKTETNSDFKLLIAGRKIWWSIETEETYNHSKFKEEIIFTGRVDNASLHKLIGAAFALVYVSLFEGFGIPIVEAMLCSVPVITSNLTSMPEVAGDAALCVNPRTDLKFVFDVLLLFRPGIIRPTEGYQKLNTYGMYKSYFKIGWRNLLKNKGYSIINIGRLALGMSVAMLIGLWIYDELSFNKYHANYDRIAKVYRNHLFNNEIISNPVHPTALGTLLKSEYNSQFGNVVLVRQRIEERVLALGENKFTQRGYFMQPEGVEMFSLKILKGTSKGINDMKSILLSASLVEKIFGSADPINQIVTMDAKWHLTVAGIYEDLPKNSEFHEASFFAPLDLYLTGWSNLNVWDNYNMNIYVQLKTSIDISNASSVIKDAMLPHVNSETAKSKPALFLLPMSEWHLSSQFKDGRPVTSDQMKFLWLYGTIGVFVLILACINFMNLSTARSEKRAKEVGIRKSIGSHRAQLIQQFFSESILVAVISLILSLLLVKGALSGFNTLSDKNISIPWNQPLFWLGIFAFTILTGILAGSYIAWS